MLPANEFSKEKVVVPETLPDACRDAVEGEKDNIAMYDRFLAFVKEPDIRETFTYLREASNNITFRRWRGAGWGEVREEIN